MTSVIDQESRNRLRDSFCTMKPIYLPRSEFSGLEFVRTRGRQGFYRTMREYGVHLPPSSRRPVLTPDIYQQPRSNTTESYTTDPRQPINFRDIFTNMPFDHNNGPYRYHQSPEDTNRQITRHTPTADYHPVPVPTNATPAAALLVHHLSPDPEPEPDYPGAESAPPPPAPPSPESTVVSFRAAAPVVPVAPQPTPRRIHQQMTASAVVHPREVKLAPVAVQTQVNDDDDVPDCIIEKL